MYENRTSMVPVVGLLRNWNAVEGSPGLSFGDVSPMRWFYNSFVTLEEGYSILVISIGFI